MRNNHASKLKVLAWLLHSQKKQRIMRMPSQLRMDVLMADYTHSTQIQEEITDFLLPFVHPLRLKTAYVIYWMQIGMEQLPHQKLLNWMRRNMPIT